MMGVIYWTYTWEAGIGQTLQTMVLKVLDHDQDYIFCSFTLALLLRISVGLDLTVNKIHCMFLYAPSNPNLGLLPLSLPSSTSLPSFMTLHKTDLLHWPFLEQPLLDPATLIMLSFYLMSMDLNLSNFAICVLVHSLSQYVSNFHG